MFFLRTPEALVRRAMRTCARSRTARGNCTDLSRAHIDTSCILAWLIEQGYEVVAFMADVGQEEVR